MKHFSEISLTAERVVDAGEFLIRERGYNGFSYDDVAQIVGIKKPSIHHHFPTKSELALVIVQRYTHRFKESLLEIEKKFAKAPDRLLAYAGLFEKTYLMNRQLCVCGMLGAEASSLPENINHEVGRFFKVNIDWLLEIIQDGQRLGLLTTSVSPQDMAEMMLAALEGSMVVGRGMMTHIGPAKTAENLLKVLIATMTMPQV